MVQLACVDVRALPLQLLLRRHPEWIAHPTVVVDRDAAEGRVLFANRHALGSPSGRARATSRP